jgi:hypothetical protein
LPQQAGAIRSDWQEIETSLKHEAVSSLHSQLSWATEEVDGIAARPSQGAASFLFRGFRSSSGSLAIFAAIRRASSLVSDADHTDADHIITDADHVSTGADHHRVTRSPPLPRPRPAELASAPVASKEKTPTPIQIND